MKTLILMGLLLLCPVLSWADGPIVSPSSGAGVEWNAVTATDLKEYRVFLKQSATVPYNYAAPFATVTPPNKSQSFTGTLQPPEGQNYVVVRAVDLANNQSIDSNQVAFVFDKTNPDAPVIRLLLAESEYEWAEERIMLWTDFLTKIG